jgi:hypothetical protein
MAAAADPRGGSSRDSGYVGDGNWYRVTNIKLTEVAFMCSSISYTLLRPPYAAALAEVLAN